MMSLSKWWFDHEFSFPAWLNWLADILVKLGICENGSENEFDQLERY